MLASIFQPVLLPATMDWPAEPLALLSDLAVERPLGDPPHRGDERFVPDLLQRAERQPPGNGGRLPSVPLETAGLSAQCEPDTLQRLDPPLRVVLELADLVKSLPS